MEISLTVSTGLQLLTAYAQRQRSALSSGGLQPAISASAQQNKGAASAPAPQIGMSGSLSITSSIAGVAANLTATAPDASAGVQVDSTGLNWLKQVENIYLQNHALSSDQITKTLYSGGGLVGDPYGDKETFLGAVDRIRQGAQIRDDWADSLTKFVAAGRPQGYPNFDASAWTSYSDADIAKLADEEHQTAAAIRSFTSGLATAFAEHRLSFESAAQVKDLHFTETVSMNYDACTGAMSGGGTQNYDHNFFPGANHGILQKVDVDGTKHSMVTVGDLVLYVTESPKG
jgi:hypothetical protein